MAIKVSYAARLSPPNGEGKTPGRGFKVAHEGGMEDAQSEEAAFVPRARTLGGEREAGQGEAEKMRRKQELLAKIRETSSPNKRIQSYLVQQQRKQLQRKMSDVSMGSYTTNNDADGDTTDEHVDRHNLCVLVAGESGTPGKPRSKANLVAQ